MRRRAVGVGAALLAAAALLLLAAAPAGAARGHGTEMHDARYCEILELKSLPPDAKVVVWNTIGLNDCPEAWWDGFDAGALAAELGDPYVVLNGPRHFLMDAAKARTGQVRSFHGERMRKVATLPIASFADLAQVPYRERSVSRLNTWHWRAGRKIYELLAPDGATYVMQSYSQIVDPSLRMADLGSLGARLALPSGWSYRVRRLRRPLTLRARGSATILQDELKNTYQRLPATKRRKARKIAVAGVTKAVGFPEPGQIHDRGTITGKPFGSGTVDLLATFGPDQTMTAEFTLANRRGSAFGTATTSYTVSGNEITFTGSATLDGGTGRYRGIKGANLKVYDHNTLDGQNGTLTLTGKVRF